MQLIVTTEKAQCVPNVELCNLLVHVEAAEEPGITVGCNGYMRLYGYNGSSRWVTLRSYIDDRPKGSDVLSIVPFLLIDRGWWHSQ